MKKIFLLLLVFIISFEIVCGNDIEIKNAVLKDQEISSRSVYIEFDISWKNSWRNSTNWDAAWVFVKFQRTKTGEWYHASLNPNSNSHSTGSLGSDAIIEAVSDKKGIFFCWADNHKGDISSQKVKVKWNYGDDYLSDELSQEVMRVGVYAIEMCYVKEGNFYIGDKASADRFRLFESDTPALISDQTVKILGLTGDNQLTVGGISINGKNGIDWNNDGVIDNPDYPTGYKAFYCMKYEISQEQYVDFLNTLTRAQQGARVGTDIIGKTQITNTYVMTNSSSMLYKSSIRCSSEVDALLPITFFCDFNGNFVPNEECDGKNLACNYLKFQDGLHYAAWAGLRPMTELEYEKACRGFANYVQSEYAWGDDAKTQSIGLGNQACGSENITGGNCHFGHNTHPYLGPLRVGIFAEISQGQRKNAGASYWGISELTGNLWEGCINFANSTGRGFRNLDNWQFENLVGVGQRGGDWNYNYMMYVNYWPVSARQLAGSSYATRENGFGFRCVRSAE